MSRTERIQKKASIFRFVMYMIFHIYIKEEDSYDECTGRKFRKEYGEAYH